MDAEARARKARDREDQKLLRAMAEEAAANPDETLPPMTAKEIYEIAWSLLHDGKSG